MQRSSFHRHAKHEEVIHPNEYRETLTRLPQLANAVIRVNIHQEIEKLKSASALQQDTGRSSENLVKYEDFRIVLVVMKAESRMSHHHADGPISVQGIQGRIRLHLPEDQTVELGPGDMLALEPGLKHDVEALEDSAFLLTISWSDRESERIVRHAEISRTSEKTTIRCNVCRVNAYVQDPRSAGDGPGNPTS